MKLRLLFPLATLLALTVALIQAGTNGVQAEPVTLSLSATNAVFGDTITVTGIVNNAAGSAVTLRVNNGVLTSPISASGTAVTGVATSSLSVTVPAGVTSETITAKYQCNSTGTTFTLQQVGTTVQTLQASLTCSANGQQQLSCQQYTLNYSPTNATNAPCASACPYQNANLLGPSMGPCSFPFPAQSQGLNSCPFPYSNPASNNYYYQNNPPSQFPSYSYPNNSGICSTPVALSLATPAEAGQVALSFSRVKQGCDQSNVVTVEVKDKSGNLMPDGTTVSAAARMGKIQPGQSTTTAGLAYFVYVGPSSGGGTDVVTATSGTAKASTNLEVVCTGVVTGALPALPPPASVPLALAPAGQPTGLAPAAGLPGIMPRITPPSTGEAGLKD